MCSSIHSWTLERYRQLITYLSPEILNVKLRDVSPFLLEKEYKRLREQGGHHRKTRALRPLSATTVHRVHEAIHVALNRAIKWKLLRANPADGCVLPRTEHKERKVLDRDESEWLFDAARDSWILRFLEVSLATGCRRGELLALTWADVDLDASVIVISKAVTQTKEGLHVGPPKSGKTRRLTLPASAVKVLMAHRAEQDEFRAKFGADYRTDLDLVFAAPDGDYRKPDSVSATASAIARKAKYKGVSLHSLRHSHGSQMLSAGVSLPVVSQRLGHSSPHITSQIYLHPVGREEIDAANVWDSKMGSALQEDEPKRPAN
jgi:integrase